MKILKCEQGSLEWIQARLGRPTASEFHKIVTPTGQFSKQSREYAFYLIAETLLNESLDSIQHLEWVARGKELEPEAIRAYEFEQDVVTRPVGFITTDDGRMGCTPDRLIQSADRPLEGVLEIKVPAPQTHIRYLLDGFGNDYTPQVQGQMLVGEFEWVDRYSYHPRLPPVLAHTVRNEPFLRLLADALARFVDEKDEMLAKVRASGFFEERKRLLTSTDDQAKSLGRGLAEYLGA